MKKQTTTKNIAIITGASSGLGIEFALQMEQKYFFDEVWLIARRVEPMKELGEKFHKAKAIILSLDLNNNGDLLSLQKKIETENPNIMFLVNNAGYGKIGPFASLGLDEQMKMIDLNVKSLTFLTKICLSFMKPGAKIIQVASSIAYCPAPFFAVYAATKSYVLSFSEALNYELKDTGITVTAVCPGPVNTEFFAVAQKNEFMKDKVGDAEPFNKSLTATPKEVVAQALLDCDKGRSESICGLPIKFFVKAMNFVPRSLAMKAIADGRKK